MLHVLAQGRGETVVTSLPVAVACRTRPFRGMTKTDKQFSHPIRVSFGRPATRAPALTPVEKYMDVLQLKLLAERLRALLHQHQVAVGHSQSLDLIAALPGLRNWPEVNAFPGRVNACQLDLNSVGRLSYRLGRRHQLDIAAPTLLSMLTPPAGVQASLQVWPGGPAPGVYVTTSDKAISALLARYEEATDGELVYAESAASGWDGSIDLGEGGLWSSGMNRVPSGTLIVVGPLELSQSDWRNSAERLQMACLRAQVSDHRVAVLINADDETETLFRDLLSMVHSVQAAGDDCDAALRGVVTDEGDLVCRQPFARSAPAPQLVHVDPPMEALPSRALELLKQATEHKTAGILLLGSSAIQEHYAIEQVAAALALTRGAGPVARIRPRVRSTPEKDMQVPDAIKALPVMASIESAYAHGYRRMIVNLAYTSTQEIATYADDVLFIAGVHGMDACDVFMDAFRFAAVREEGGLLRNLIAILGVGILETSAGTLMISDLFLPQPFDDSALLKFEDVIRFLRANRVLRWEDEVSELLGTKQVSLATIKKTFARVGSVEDFLKSRNTAQKKAVNA